jgi:hypothetical protein
MAFVVFILFLSLLLSVKLEVMSQKHQKTYFNLFE